MKKVLKRLGAYFIDIIIITIVVTLLTSNNKVNFQYDNYTKYYEEYTKVAQKYTSTISKQSNLEKKYKDKKISKKKYKSKNEEYETKVKSYEKKIKKLQYKITRNSVVHYLVYIALILGYFGIFQYSFNGQTLGKKLLGVQVVTNSEKSLKIWQLLLRSLILFNLWVTGINILIAYTFNVNTYYRISTIVSECGSVIQLLTLMMIIISKSGRGLHDYAAMTKVILIDKEGKEIIESTGKSIEDEKEVIETEVIEQKSKKVKLTVKKSNTAKKKGDK